MMDPRVGGGGAAAVLGGPGVGVPIIPSGGGGGGAGGPRPTSSNSQLKCVFGMFISADHSIPLKLWLYLIMCFSIFT